MPPPEDASSFIIFVVGSSSSALQLWKSLGLLNSFRPLMSILDQVWPFYHFQLFQIVFDVVFPFGLGPAYRSICEWVPFIYFLLRKNYINSLSHFFLRALYFFCVTCEVYVLFLFVSWGSRKTRRHVTYRLGDKALWCWDHLLRFIRLLLTYSLLCGKV